MRILGLDLGTTSVGFALVEHDEARERGSIVRMGVRIFPEGITEKDREPRNKQRRVKRLARRTLRRRRLRRRLLNEALAEAGFLPKYGTPEWRAAMAADPYTLRAAALERALTSGELGRALYHLAKRRGYLGRRLDEGRDADAKKEEEGIKAEIKGLAAEIGSSTLGATLAKKDKRRGHHTSRDMVEAEFERVWTAQAPHHPALTAEFKARLDHLIFFQRPVFWRLSTLGQCRFMPREPLAPKGSWLAQRYVMLEQITKLRIAGGNARRIAHDPEEFAAVVAVAEKQGSVSWGGLRKILKPIWVRRGESAHQQFNMEVAKSADGVKGNRVEADLRKIFGAEWDVHPQRDRIRREIHQRLWTADYKRIGETRVEIRRQEEAAAERARVAAEIERDWLITADQARALAAMELPPGWLRNSTKSIETMLPELETGTGVGDLTMSPEWAVWRQHNFPHMERPTGEIMDRLPSHPRKMPELRNPTVHRVLNEIRKVVNNLVRTYGTPDLIRIELARDLRRSAKERSEALSRNKEQEKRRKQAAEELEKHGIANPGGRDIEKWLLWKESNERCPYTGDHISFEALFKDGRYQVEHIWPRSKSLDNSFVNKTLCRVDVNADKGNRTPFEWCGGEDEKLEQLKKTVADAKLPDWKVRRFFKDKIAEAGSDDFAERQLQDTRWAAVAARDFLKRLYPDDGRPPPVATANGSVTAQLRRHWGLETILSPEGGGKNRDDHRHHAVDALAVALTSRAFVKRLSDFYAGEKLGKRPALPQPWPTLRDDAIKAVAGIVVSHRVQKKLSGALHAETYYGDTGEDARTKSGVYRRYVTRKPVERLSKTEIDDIRDERVREIVRAHVAARGGEPKKAIPPYPTLPNRGGEPVEIRRVRLTVKQQASLMVPLRHAHADPAGNHHMAIYRLPDGKIDFEVVSLFEAVRRQAKREPVVRRSRTDGEEFLMSLSPGDVLEFPNSGTAPDRRIVTSLWSAGPIVLVDHRSASGEVWKRPTAASIVAGKARKVSVDPIGRVRPAAD